MRLIDADAVIYRVMGNGLKPITEQIFRKLIDDEPTIDAVEVVRGEWIDKMNYRDGSYYSICSECGYFDDERDDLTAYNFCPNCGAKMDGEREGE